jgi:hypothetical protein
MIKKQGTTTYKTGDQKINFTGTMFRVNGLLHSLFRVSEKSLSGKRPIINTLRFYEAMNYHLISNGPSVDALRKSLPGSSVPAAGSGRPMHYPHPCALTSAKAPDGQAIL